MIRSIATVAFFILGTHLLADEPRATKTENGRVTFKPTNDQSNIPASYRLQEYAFDYELKLQKTMPLTGVDVFELRFPSPVKTPHAENNIVYAEYYRPMNPKSATFPCVIVLDITGGDHTLSRVIARNFAQNGIGGLFVQMAYYGPRRPSGSSIRFMSYDVEQTLANVKQTVMDLRCAAAWMESRPEIDAKNLGIMGTSLGSFVAALTCQMEPRLGRLTVLLGGGGFVDGFWDHPQAKPYREMFEFFGGTKEDVRRVLAPIDPITCAHLLKDRKVLIVAAKNDEIVSPRMAENLWKSSGQQRIIWLNAGHYTAILYLISGLNDIVEHHRAR